MEEQKLFIALNTINYLPSDYLIASKRETVKL